MRSFGKLGIRARVEVQGLELSVQGLRFRVRQDIPNTIRKV